MRILIATSGTRGDVQPAIVLCDELARAGHTVRLCAPKCFAAWAARLGIDFVAIDFDVARAITAEAPVLEGGSQRRFFQWVEQQEGEAEHAYADALVAASEGMDAIVAHPMLVDRAAAVAEALRIPIVTYSTVPLYRTREFSPLIMGSPRLGVLNPLAHSLYLRLHWRAVAPAVQRLRARLGVQPVNEAFLARAARERLPSIETYSTTLCPRPADWGDERVMTGVVRLSQPLRDSLGERTLPAELLAWLDDRPAPLFVSFGSMPLLDKPGLVDAIEGEAERRGIPVVFGLGWSQLDRVTSDRSFFVRDVNHAALLPRCVAAMHHGGAGSTAAAAEAGIPAIVCAAFVDQPFWARRIEALGAGVALPYQRFTQARFASALDRALDAELQTRACEIGVKVRAEDGAKVLAQAVRTCLNAARGWRAPLRLVPETSTPLGDFRTSV